MDLISQGYVQWGFAGFAFMLLGIIVWMFKQLIAVVHKNNAILAKLIDTIKSVENTERETKDSVDKLKVQTDSMRDLLLAKPCIRGGM